MDWRSRDNAGWVEAEFARAELGTRAPRRGWCILPGQGAGSLGALHGGCNGQPATRLKGVYRFIKGSTGDDAGGHPQRPPPATIRRISDTRQVLASTTMTRWTLQPPGCNGLGQIGSNQTGAVRQRLTALDAGISETGLPLASCAPNLRVAT